jgi:hypothetical protein
MALPEAMPLPKPVAVSGADSKDVPAESFAGGDF